MAYGFVLEDFIYYVSVYPLREVFGAHLGVFTFGLVLY